MTIGRRVLIGGAVVAGFSGAAGIFAFRAATQGAPTDRGSAAYFDAVTEDYRAGRVVVVAGWIVSETEVNAFRPPAEDGQ